MYYTHLAFGFLFALFVLPYVKSSNLMAYFLLVLLGSVLPDIDSRHSKISKKIKPISYLIRLLVKHRGFTHSIFFGAFILLIAKLLGDTFYLPSIFIGYLSHILIDSLTKNGINFLHPVTTFRIKGFIESGTSGEMVILLLIIISIFLQLYSF